MKVVLSVIWLLFSSLSFCQKKLIDSSTYHSWPSLEGVQISDDGEYVSYVTNIGSGIEPIIHIVQSSGKWNFEKHGFFVVDFIRKKGSAILCGRDSAFVLSLGTDSLHYIEGYLFKIVDENGDTWLVRRAAQVEGKVMLVNFRTSKTILLSNVLNLSLLCMNKTGNQCLLKVIVRNDKDERIVKVDFSKLSAETVWKGMRLGSFLNNYSHTEAAFFGNQRSVSEDSAYLFLYDFDKQFAHALSPKVIFDAKNDNRKIIVEDIASLENDGSKIFLNIRYLNPDRVRNMPPSLHIWSYNDSMIAPYKSDNYGETAVASMTTSDGSIKVLCNGPNQVISFNEFGENKWIVKRVRYLQPGAIAKDQCDLISTSSNNVIPAPFDGNISPSGRYYLYYDYERDKFFSIDLFTSAIHDITTGSNVSWLRNDNGDYDSYLRCPRGIAGWCEDGRSVFVYDQYDLWKLDMKGEKKPQNITNAYGRHHKIVFNLLTSRNELLPVKLSGAYLVSFNKESKRNGFFIMPKRQSTPADPIELTQEDCFFYYPGAIDDVEQGFKPLKAISKDVYILRKMSSTEFPNLYLTSNFRSFSKLTHFAPQKKVNWYKTRLYDYFIGDNIKMSGVMYLPENFDSTITYPVIFYYYRKSSDALNQYITPYYSEGKLNIPWYVSHGYIVFTPDIYYWKGQTGNSALQSVLAARKRLVALPFVDSNHLALQGISFAGFETNYIIAHTDKFAAACTASGISDVVSAYNSLYDNELMESLFEKGNYQFGSMLWDDKEGYIDNSPILFANNVTTPLLIMQTTKDVIVPFNNALEYFIALRRLGKKTWMLQYDDSVHGVFGAESRDFDQRLRDFFNYYLKGGDIPSWMGKVN
jgi:dienelactone hydrolase